MNRQLIILLLENDELVDQYLEFVSQELGRIKIESIVEKIKKSSTVQKFLVECSRMGIRPGTKDFINCINQMRGFFFSGQETISIASVMLLGYWNIIIGAPLQLSDNNYLNRMFFSILDQCNNGKLHLNHRENLFERFFNHINQISKEEFDRLMETKTLHEVFFDDVFFKAAENEKKIQFRAIDNLELINIFPNEVQYSHYNNDKKRAVFYSQKLNQNFEITPPYILNSTIDIINSFTDEKIKAKVTSCSLQRLADISYTDACNEGYNEFETDPEADIEDLLIDDLCKKYHTNLFENPRLWAIEFEIIKTTDRSHYAKDLGLTDSAVNALLAII